MRFSIIISVLCSRVFALPMHAIASSTDIESGMADGALMLMASAIEQFELGFYSLPSIVGIVNFNVRKSQYLIPCSDQ